jgi:hypothetical protein
MRYPPGNRSLSSEPADLWSKAFADRSAWLAVNGLSASLDSTVFAASRTPRGLGLFT